MAPISFSINFDYRCPFARNANEHVLAALEGGAEYEVQFKTFSLSQVHLDEGEPPVWENPAKRVDLVALAAGVVVRDRFPAIFPTVHRALFALRHDEGEDLRDEKKVRDALARAGADAEAIFDEIDAGWPIEVIRDEHLESVERHSAFGVPTFIAGDEAVFVRLMTRPAGDGALARRTVDRVLDLLVHNPELNEYKHTTVPR